MRLIIIFIFLIIPHFWAFAQNSKIEEFNTAYKLAYIINQESLKHAKKCLEIASSLQNDSLIASSYIAISFNYQYKGNLTQALNSALKAQPLFKTSYQNTGYVVANSQIAGIYIDLKEYALALKYFKKANSIAQSFSNINYALLIPINQNIGNAYREIEQFDSALNYLYIADTFAKKSGLNYVNGYIYSNLGLTYAALGEKSKSDSLIALCLTALKQNNDFRAIAETYNELALILYKEMEYNNALSHANKAYYLADSMNFTVELKDITLNLSNIYRDLGNFKQAYHLLSRFNYYSNLIYGDSVSSNIAEMRAEFEISQNEAELTYHKNLSVARTRLLFVALAGFLVISILAFYAVRQSRKRKEANAELSEANEELTQKNEVISQQSRDKDMLMKEIHHRVKNNLQIISSIMNLQSMRIDNKQTLDIFEEMQRRIMAISGIHQKLYQSESVSVINVKDYLSEIVEAIHGAFNNHELNVNYQIAVENIELSVDVAVALGLIVNELATNAYKYAFTPDKENTLILTLNKTKNKHLLVSLRDNGPGLDKDFKFEDAESLGLRMVLLLTRQQNGEITIKDEQGACFEFDFDGSF